MKLSDIISQIKIDTAQLKPNEARAGAGVEAKAKIEAKNAPDSTQASGDRVNISASAQDIQRIKEILAQTPEVRLDKVQALKKQIERGEYQVDAPAVADRMLQTLLTERRI